MLGDISWPLFFQHIKYVNLQVIWSCALQDMETNLFWTCTNRGTLKGSDLVFDTTAKDSIHLYFPKREGGLSSPFGLIVPKDSSADKLLISSFLFSCIERIQTLGKFFKIYFTFYCPS